MTAREDGLAADIDALLEAAIENSGGRWCDGEFRIEGSDLMKMLRTVAEQPAGAVGERPIAWEWKSPHYGVCYRFSDSFNTAFPNAPVDWTPAAASVDVEVIRQTLRTARDLDDATQKIAALIDPAGGAKCEDYITVQQAWEWAGGNPGIKATKQELIDALRTLDEVCDAADAPQSDGVVALPVGRVQRGPAPHDSLYAMLLPTAPGTPAVKEGDPLYATPPAASVNLEQFREAVEGYKRAYPRNDAERYANRMLALIDSAGGAKETEVQTAVRDELAEFVTRIPEDAMHRRLIALGWTPPQPDGGDGAVAVIPAGHPTSVVTWLRPMPPPGTKLYPRPSAAAVVDEAMVERALAAYAEHAQRNGFDLQTPAMAKFRREWLRKALTAALATPRAEHGGQEPQP